MRIRRSSRARQVGLLALGLVFAAGCELAVNFDRDKIVGEPIDASFGDTQASDQGSPAPPSDASDAPSDVADATSDAADAADASDAAATDASDAGDAADAADAAG